ncbi:hypothetical protein ACA910_001189 [Epithemia clementina (nom. ined.)]
MRLRLATSIIRALSVSLLLLAQGGAAAGITSHPTPSICNAEPSRQTYRRTTSAPSKSPINPPPPPTNPPFVAPEPEAIEGSEPTDVPTKSPTDSPTKGPTNSPTPAPTKGPTNAPTPAPTNSPTPSPTKGPTNAPTPAPTNTPTLAPTKGPTNGPTPAPTNSPTSAPTKSPTPAPTKSPTPAPTNAPTPAPTKSPTPAPTNVPTPAPTNAPTPSPTKFPTPAPTKSPTPAPTNAPTSNAVAAAALSNPACPTGTAVHHEHIGDLVGRGSCSAGSVYCGYGNNNELAFTTQVKNAASTGSLSCTVHGTSDVMTFTVTEVIRKLGANGQQDPNGEITGIGLKIDWSKSAAGWYMYTFYTKNGNGGMGYDADGKLFTEGIFAGPTNAEISHLSVCVKQCPFSGAGNTLDEYGCPRAWPLLQTWDLIVLNEFKAGQDVEGKLLVGGSVTTTSPFQVAIHSQPTTDITFAVGGRLTASANDVHVQQGNMAHTGLTVSSSGGSTYVDGRKISLKASGAQVLKSTTLAKDIENYKAQLEYLSFSFLAGLPKTGTVSIPGPSDQPRAAFFLVDKVDSTGNAVFHVDGNQLLNNDKVQQIQVNFANGLNENSPKFLIINVGGTTITWNYGSLVNGFFQNKRPQIIWNFYEATTLTLRKQGMGIYLAPFAELDIMTNIEGAAFVRNFKGNGEIHYPLAAACPFTWSNVPSVEDLSTGGAAINWVNKVNWDAAMVRSLGPWQCGSTTDCAFLNNGNYPAPQYTIRLRDDSGIASSVFTELSGVKGITKIKISFSFVVVSFENSEDFMLEYSFDNFSTTYGVATWVNSQDFVNNRAQDNVEEEVIFNTPVTSNSMKIRFRADASKDDDELYIYYCKIDVQ